eukprot:TRINITY_DN5889_c0_g1_i1.p1 TRINITY_DN5889_c0_g1~~TRINITY_DN5889_c0_g1_i1.p1  ORF type:complete len:157 (-),score=7.33 TRINITY_DN5889_c0_g1_i1:695-1165(-)
MAVWGHYIVYFNGDLGPAAREAWMSADAKLKAISTANTKLMRSPSHSACIETASSPEDSDPISLFRSERGKKNFPNLDNDTPPQFRKQFETPVKRRLPIPSEPSSPESEADTEKSGRPPSRLQLQAKIHRKIKTWAKEQISSRKATRQRDQGRALR